MKAAGPGGNPWRFLLGASAPGWERSLKGLIRGSVQRDHDLERQAAAWLEAQMDTRKNRPGRHPQRLQPGPLMEKSRGGEVMLTLMKRSMEEALAGCDLFNPSSSSRASEIGVGHFFEEAIMGHMEPGAGGSTLFPLN